MKPLLYLSACGLALMSAAACAPTAPPTARAALDCPANQGDLERTSISPDKKTCLYASRDGDQVSLRLIPVSANYEMALQPVEQELQAEVQTDQEAASAKVTVAAGDAKAAAADAKAAAASATEAEKAARQAAEDAGHELADADKDDKDTPRGAHPDRNEHAHIDLPGIHIDADDDGKADVNVGMIHVNAGENGAVVRMSRDVRLRGEAFSRDKRGFRATYILAKDNLKDGWKTVGYEAAGPKAGPITVAVVKARTGDHHDVFDDVKRLVRRNGGV
ncbi:hypothetical protein [Phenylobacterium sp.]|uniref:hypothetical protein n=1 Tax=Phenylobacterium sp. TaxID=1871053 RepID=UPI003562BF77